MSWLYCWDWEPRVNNWKIDETRHKTVTRWANACNFVQQKEPKQAHGSLNPSIPKTLAGDTEPNQNLHFLWDASQHRNNHDAVVPHCSKGGTQLQDTVFTDHFVLPHHSSHPQRVHRQPSLSQGSIPGSNPSCRFRAGPAWSKYRQKITVQETNLIHRKKADSLHPQVRRTPLLLLHYFPAADPCRFWAVGFAWFRKSASH